MGKNDRVEITITCTMKERWVDHFLSMLKCMEDFGNIGHSGLIGFYADGDGDFRPKFNFDCDFNRKDGIPREYLYSTAIPEVLFDADSDDDEK